MNTATQIVETAGVKPEIHVVAVGKLADELRDFSKSNLSFKLRQFADLLQREQIERLKAEDLACDANILNAKTNYHIGRKYSRVDVGSSGKYMIDNVTEEIFGIKGYGVVHKGYRFGTLDTINDWHWGDYRAIKRKTLAG